VAKPKPTSKDITSIKLGTPATFHIDGTDLHDVDFDEASPPGGNKGSVTITSRVASWKVHRAKSQGNDGKKIQVKATAAAAASKSVVTVSLFAAQAKLLATGDMTVTVTNPGGQQGVLNTTIDYV
jgi:hypothetical protein